MVKVASDIATGIAKSTSKTGRVRKRKVVKGKPKYSNVLGLK